MNLRFCIGKIQQIKCPDELKSYQMNFYTALHVCHKCGTPIKYKINVHHRPINIKFWFLLDLGRWQVSNVLLSPKCVHLKFIKLCGIHVHSIPIIETSNERSKLLELPEIGERPYFPKTSQMANFWYNNLHFNSSIKNI